MITLVIVLQCYNVLLESLGLTLKGVLLDTQ